MYEVVIALAAFVLACGFTAVYRSTFRKLEPPSERGMHTVPVPSGAGVAIVGTILLLWPVALGFGSESLNKPLLVALASLTAVSWLDDRYRLPAGARFIAHAAAVIFLLSTLDTDLQIVPIIPVVLERIVLGLGWLWFINLFNFMDGIDGIAGAEAIAIAGGGIAVAAAADLAGPHRELSLIVAASCAGYLVWNWHPAKVFMGDAGSIPLGFLLGWVLLDLAVHGYWHAALILPAYFAADATLTLIARLRRREKPWTPHREHFYQRAVLGGGTVPAVVAAISAANVILAVLAIASVQFPVVALGAAAAVVLVLLSYLQYLASGSGRQTPQLADSSPARTP